MSWQDDPRTDNELLEAYCVPALDGGEDWWAFPALDGGSRGVPRRAADQAEFTRAWLLLGLWPGDAATSQMVSRLVMKVRELERRLDEPSAGRRRRGTNNRRTVARKTP